MAGEQRESCKQPTHSAFGKISTLFPKHTHFDPSEQGMLHFEHEYNHYTITARLAATSGALGCEFLRRMCAVLKISQDHVIYAFSAAMAAVATVESGSTVVFETVDALGGQVTHEGTTLDSLDFSRVNPATGPVAIAGAQPGDALLVEILDIVTADHGVMLAVPNLGILGDRVSTPSTKVVAIGGQTVTFNQWSLPKQPMIGVIGTAPQTGSVPCGTPSDHGGNMDTKDIRAGASIYLPVFQPGGLLAMGDVHAAMADGEVCGAGVECSADITVRVHRVPGFAIQRPLIVTQEAMMAVASAETIEAAAKMALEQIVQFLVDKEHLSFNDAYMLCSLVVDMRISQLVDPLLTVRAVLPQTYLTAPLHL